MEINKLKKRDGIDSNKKLTDLYVQFGKLLSELRKRNLPDKVVQSINTNIDLINPALETEEQWRKQLRKTQSDILRLIEKEESLSEYLAGLGYSRVWSTSWRCFRSQSRQHGIYGHWNGDGNPRWAGNRYRTGQKSSG